MLSKQQVRIIYHIFSYTRGQYNNKIVLLDIASLMFILYIKSHYIGCAEEGEKSWNSAVLEKGITEIYWNDHVPLFHAFDQ